MANPVLLAAISGTRKVLLTWTYGANADFKIFWKSNKPAGQEYVLLATTNGFSYLTADLDPSKIYSFYVGANVGIYFFYSNVVELFVSCGKGVVLSIAPPDPPVQQFGGIYAYIPTLDVYRQTSRTGLFSAYGSLHGVISVPMPLYSALMVRENKDAWVAILNGGIYIQYGGEGDYIYYQDVSWRKDWRSFAVAANGVVYGSAFSDQLYTLSPGASDWVSLNQGVRWWYGLTIHPNGNVYASVWGGGDIYMQTGGVGDFVALNQGGKNWTGMVATAQGDVYASVQSGDIYKQTNGAGAFNALNQTVRAWTSMTATPEGDVFACAGTASGGIFKQEGGVGDFIAYGNLNPNNVPGISAYTGVN